MSLVSQKIPHLLGGVSQQPESVMGVGQTPVQDNALASPTRGLRKRPPTRHIAKIDPSTTGYASAFSHVVNGGSASRYIAVVVNGDLKVFDLLSGAAKTVLFPKGKTYLTSTAGFRAVTVGDYTYLVNRDKLPAQGTTKAPAQAKEALVCVKQGDYSTEYILRLNGSAVSYTTPDVGAVGADAAVKPGAIATELVVALIANALINSTYDFIQYGSTIWIQKKTLADFTITTEDGLADGALVAIKGTVQTIDDLPHRAKPGMVIKVVGDAGSPQDDFWATYSAAEGTPDQAGLWLEVPAPGTILDFNKATMPWALIRGGPVLEDVVESAVPHAAGVLFVDASTRLYEFDPAEIYPPTSTITVTASDNGTPSSYPYTVPGSTPVTSADVVTALIPLINAGAPFSALLDDANSFELARVSVGHTFTNQICTVTVPATTFWNRALAMAPGEHVGRTVRNLTDGSSGTITANGTTHIVVASLTGGADNAFAPGDEIQIVGTGEYFVFDTLPWKQRTAGDMTSSPFPSFIGKPITDVFFLQNRLGFTSGPNVVMSASGDPLRLFRKTVTDLLPDDPIDVAGANAAVPGFDSAVLWDKSLLLSSLDGRQFELTGQPALTPTTVRIDQVSAFPQAGTARPLPLGTKLYLPADVQDSAGNTFGHLVEASRDSYGNLQGTSITEQVPTYLKGHTAELVGDAKQGLLFARSVLDWWQEDLPTGLRLLWRLDEPGATDAAIDAAATYPLPTVTGAPTVVPGHASGARNFGGTSYLRGPSDASILTKIKAGNFSFRFWVWRNSATNGGVFGLADVGMGGATWALYVSFDAAGHIALGNSDQGAGGSVATVGTGAWHHVVVVVNITGTTYSITFYVDGVSSAGPGISRTGLSPATPTLFLGRSNTAGSGILSGDVRLDDVAFFDRPLTAPEVAADFASGSPEGPVGGAGSLYVHSFKDESDQRVMSNWSRWTFTGARVLAQALFDGRLSLVILRSDGIYLEQVDLVNLPAPTADHQDRQGTATKVPYTFRYRLPLYLRNRQGQAETFGRLQVRNVDLGYHDASDFKVTVSPNGRPVKTYTFHSTISKTGTLHVPVLCRNTEVAVEIVNDQPGGCAFTAVDWEGTLTSRSSRA